MGIVSRTRTNTHILESPFHGVPKSSY